MIFSFLLKIFCHIVSKELNIYVKTVSSGESGGFDENVDICVG